MSYLNGTRSYQNGRRTYQGGLGQSVFELPLAPTVDDEAIRAFHRSTRRLTNVPVRPYDRSWISEDWNEWTFVAMQQWDQLEWSTRNRLGKSDPLYMQFRTHYDAFHQWLSTLGATSGISRTDWTALYHWDELLLTYQREIEQKLLTQEGEGFKNQRLIPGKTYAATHTPDFLYRATSLFRPGVPEELNIWNQIKSGTYEALQSNRFLLPMITGGAALLTLVWLTAQSGARRGARG